ncbi:MAG: serine/threonine protein kinase [Gammaproteobacteria bacterium]|nr:serine/threonine protein kinase [Gammaproteobacteria bacterium]MBU1624635.1 serine/threonine protein kinase [Gammaproteobacteria bacterium]MBU1982479.1 serine/threonine protein kinase [Gammaproteobacteria bacterium]
MSVNPPILRIGPYSIVRELGEGATSNVYLALRDDSYASVALKQLRKASQSDLHKSMFTDEVELGQKMQHRNIVRVIDADLNEKTGAYLVMEYINGKPLDRNDNVENLLPLDKVLSVTAQVAEALKYAAGMGVVHRDVKPGNIILMPNGVAKLADFGCAIPVSEMGAVVAGSLAYMSPEQIEGEALDQRSDIYSLGAVMYRLLTGHYSFEADNQFDARIAIINFPIIPIENYRQELPKVLTDVVERAMQKGREERYANWDEFIADLAKAIHLIEQSDYDMDLYRGFSMQTQAELSNYMSRSRAFSRSVFSRSGFSRSTVPDTYGGG